MTVCTPAFWRHGVAQALIALALYLPGSSPKDAALPSVTRFEAVMRYTLDWEGGYLWDPDDPGGETNHGISRRQYPHLDIANLTRVQTMAIYLRDYWRPYHEDIASYQIASRLFDLSVNMGYAHPNKML